MLSRSRHTRPTALLAGALALPLLVTGCGTSTAAASLKEDNAKARAALRDARAVEVGLSLSDPGGALAKAMTSEEGGLTTEQAKVLLGLGISVVVDAAGDRRLSDQPAAGASLQEQLEAASFGLRVDGAGGRLAELRLVDGTLYAAAEGERLEAVSAAFDGPDLATALDGLPPELAGVGDAVRSGTWLSLSVSEYAAQLEELTKTAPQPDPSALTGLFDDLTSAIEPAVKLTELGVEDGVRTVSVDVDVRKALTAVGDVLAASGSSVLPVPGLGQALEGDLVSADPVRATLTIEDGHYTGLRIPLQELVDLAPTPDPDMPDLGDSALVISLDDTADELAAPTDLADVDLDAALQGLIGGLLGGAGAGLGTDPECLVDPTLC